MRTITVHDVPDAVYEALEDEASRQGRTVSSQLVHLLERSLQPRKLHSILELRGLGKEAWEGVDPVEYLREERESWT